MNAERLIATLLSSRCSDEEVLAFVALLLRQADVALDEATSAALFSRLSELIGASPTDSDEALHQKLHAYYHTHPPPPALEHAVADFFKGQLGVATSDAFDALAAKARTERYEPIPSRPVFEVHDPERK